MADITVPQIASGFRPVGLDVKPQNQMSLGDIVNMAATAQAYQKQQELMPYQIEQGKAQSEAAQLETERKGIDLNVAKQNIVRGVLGSYLYDPEVIAGNGKYIAEKLNEARQSFRAIGVESPDGGKMMDKLIADAQTNPKQVYQDIKNGLQMAGGASSQYQSLQGSQNVPIYAGQGGAGGGGGAGGQQYGLQKVGGEALPYPVRQPGIQFTPGPSEAQDMTSGQEFRTALRNKAESVPVNRRNIQEVLSVTNQLKNLGVPTYGKAGEFQQAYNKFAGTDTGVLYAQLSKDLANTQISQMGENELKTVGGQQLQAAANGTTMLPPEVLTNIARRQAAQNTALELQSNGAEKFANRFQDRNMKVFQKQWQNNADSKVFELISLENSGLSDQELEKEMYSLLGRDPATIKKYIQKARNIKKLSETGGL